jgi:cell division protein FtsN
MIAAGVVISAAMIAGSVLIYPKQSGTDALLTEAKVKTSEKAPPQPQMPDDVALPAADPGGSSPDNASRPDPKKELKSEIAELEAAYNDEEPPSAGPSRPISSPYGSYGSPYASQRADQMPKQARTSSATESPTKPGATPATAPGGSQGLVLHQATSDSVVGPGQRGTTFSAASTGSVSNPIAAEPAAPRSGLAPNGLLPGNRTAVNQFPGGMIRSPQGSQAELRAESRVEGDISGDEMYFEVGDFKDLDWAERATNELARFGFAARILHKRRLWMNSYHVLVGPYSSDNEAEMAREGLELHGYKPRFAR